jgi:hypothetical protein
MEKIKQGDLFSKKDSGVKIKYNGAYPNLCSGDLTVWVDGRKWEFEDHCLSSGGSVFFKRNWEEVVEKGDWSVNTWPKGFPEGDKKRVLEAINTKIPHGCCGGCV